MKSKDFGWRTYECMSDCPGAGFRAREYVPPEKQPAPEVIPEPVC